MAFHNSSGGSLALVGLTFLILYPFFGKFQVVDEVTSLRVYPDDCSSTDNLLEVAWNCGPVGYQFETFQAIRDRATKQWLRRDAFADVISVELRSNIVKESV